MQASTSFIYLHAFTIASLDLTIYLKTVHHDHAGEYLIHLLAGIYNSIIGLDYIHENLRGGMRIPLYEGKNTCPLYVNPHSDITLLTCMSKMFEILVWERTKCWWEEGGIISSLQGACRKGSSCPHSALVLQESIDIGLGREKNAFVAYLNAYPMISIVSRPTVCPIFQLRCLRRLVSDEVQHTSGFLCLLKYAAFINPLLRDIENSGFICCIINTPASPIGYADDLSSII